MMQLTLCQMAILKNGYNLIYRNGRHVYEHRFKIEQLLGRRLKRHEQVHHKNGKRADNRLSNLELCESQLHHARISKTYGRPKQKPCYCGRAAHGNKLCKNHYAQTFRKAQGW